jgi:hypothetical protein
MCQGLLAETCGAVTEPSSSGASTWEAVECYQFRIPVRLRILPVMNHVLIINISDRRMSPRRPRGGCELGGGRTGSAESASTCWLGIRCPAYFPSAEASFHRYFTEQVSTRDL